MFQLLSHVVPTSSASQQIVNACGNRSNPASGLDSCIAGSGQHEEQNVCRFHTLEQIFTLNIFMHLMLNMVCLQI